MQKKQIQLSKRKKQKDFSIKTIEKTDKKLLLPKIEKRGVQKQKKLKEHLKTTIKPLKKVKKAVSNALIENPTEQLVNPLKSARKKVRKIRFAARKFFLTVSKIVNEELINKEKLRDLLLAKEDSLSHYMIGREYHVDGSVHYHIYLKYSRKREFYPMHFDYLGKHPKIETCRSAIGSYMYISKEDKEPLANFDYEAGILRGTPQEIAIYLGQIGKSYDDLFKGDNNSIHLLATKWRSIKAWEQEYMEKKRMAEISKSKKGIKYIDRKLIEERLTKEEIGYIDQDSGLQKIIEHINQLTEYKWNRPFKMKNLLLWSKRVNLGKTSLIHKLSEYCPMYGFPTDQWFHGYKSETFWGIIWNEMNLTGYDLDLLKNFLEGTSVKLAIKGSQVDKRDNPEVFMTSNKSLEMMIKKKYGVILTEDAEIDLEALKARIEEVNVDRYENIFFMSKLIVPIE